MKYASQPKLYHNNIEKKEKKKVLLQVLFHITSETMQALDLIWFWEKTVPIWIIPWQPNYKILAASQSQSTG